MLDASKAFDVVSHNTLMEAMYDHDIQGNSLLPMKNCWYEGMSSQIIWEGAQSRRIMAGQRLHQGGGLPASQYIIYSNNNLVIQEEAKFGLKIGTQYMG